MLEHYEIEHGLEAVSKLIKQLEAEIIKIEAKAAVAVTENPNAYAQITNDARSEIYAVTEQYRKKIDKATIKTVTALAETDLSAQMALYQQAFEKGVLRAAPLVGESIQAAITSEVARNMAFMKETLDRVEQYAGRNIANIVQNSAYNLFNGETVEKVVKAAAIDIRDKGLQITLPSGRNVNDIEAYMRRHVVSSVAANSMAMQGDLADTLDIDPSKKWYETSSHIGPRPEHEVWQGRIFKSWDEFVATTGYGTVTGIGGVNCRHTWYVFIQGVSTQRFFPISKEENDARYKAQQQQRYYERMVRQWKTQLNVNEAMGLDTATEKAKVSQYQAALREWTKQNDLTRQYAREQVAK